MGLGGSQEALRHGPSDYRRRLVGLLCAGEADPVNAEHHQKKARSLWTSVPAVAATAIGRLDVANRHDHRLRTSDELGALWSAETRTYDGYSPRDLPIVSPSFPGPMAHRAEYRTRPVLRRFPCPRGSRASVHASGRRLCRAEPARQCCSAGIRRFRAPDDPTERDRAGGGGGWPRRRLGLGL